MAFGLVGRATRVYQSSYHTVSCDKPSGVQQGDIMFALLSRLDSALPSSVPSGWTIVDDGYTTVNRTWALYYKVAGASEPSSYTWQWAASAKTLVQTVAYRDGFDTSDPIDVYSNLHYITSDYTCRGGSITVSMNSSPVVFAGGAFSGSTLSFTPPSGFTEDEDFGHTDPDFWGTFSHKTFNAGATGDQDATSSTSGVYKHAFLVALNPLSSTPVTVAASVAEAGAEGRQCTVGAVLTVATPSAEAAAEGLRQTVATGTTVTILPTEAGAEGQSCAIATASTIQVAPAEAGAEGTWASVEMGLAVVALSADASAQGQQIAVSAACHLGTLSAQAGAEGLVLDVAVLVVVDASPADAGVEGLVAEVQTQVTISALSGVAAAEGLTMTVQAGTAGLRRTYPAMVRAYPPLCRAA
jgi:hypothetical protein